MEKFFKRKSTDEQQSSSNHVQITSHKDKARLPNSKIVLEVLEADPGLRRRISEYHPNDQDAIRREYILKGPYQPREHNFPGTMIGGKKRKFCPSWFSEYPNWLEYSVKKDAVYCLCCYLFRGNISAKGGGDCFILAGFTSWNKKARLKEHVGGALSEHNKAWRSSRDLLNKDQHIEAGFDKQDDQSRNVYRVRLTASVICARFLLRQGLPFRGHDESKTSTNQGNFLELHKFLAEHCKEIGKHVLKNAPENHQLVAPDIQKDIVSVVATETTLAILKELGSECFSIIVDEARDVSKKEQMAVALRFVNAKGCIMERLLGIVHVEDTCSLTLNAAIKSLLSKHGLCVSRIRGQGYDGASNMRGELNGLKSLILQENPSAFYIHCFAHQLQLTLVAVATEEDQVQSFFDYARQLINVVGSSCKRVDKLRELQLKKVNEQLASGEIQSGQGLNQETGLKRPGDTRWSSHFYSLQSLIGMYSSVIGVLEIISDEAVNGRHRYEARGLIRVLHTFDFIFTLHLMRKVLSITNGLSQALQRKDQDIVNAVNLLNLSKQRLQKMRDSGWDDLLHEVSLFCTKHDIEVPDMNERFSMPGRRRSEPEKLAIDHYRASLFYVVLDRQLQELNDRFSETSTELLLCVGCFSPANSFAAFDEERLIHLARFYPSDFSDMELLDLEEEIEMYIFDMHGSEDFSHISGIGMLAEKLVETQRNLSYPLVYRLLKLALILPVATATVERVFSAMRHVKDASTNRMGDDLLNDRLVTYIEKDVSDSVDKELVLQRFQKMKTRRFQL